VSARRSSRRTKTSAGLSEVNYVLTAIGVRNQILLVVVGGLVVGVLAMGPNIRGFKPGRGRWIFKGDNNP